jgi:hypothetical protein
MPQQGNVYSRNRQRVYLSYSGCGDVLEKEDEMRTSVKIWAAHWLVGIVFWLLLIAHGKDPMMSGLVIGVCAATAAERMIRLTAYRNVADDR